MSLVFRANAKFPALIGALMLLACRGEGNAPAPTASGIPSLGEIILAVGDDESLPGHDLHLVTGAQWLPGKRLLVINSGSAEVRLFDEKGRLLHVLGGPGAGPGEYRGLRAAWTAGDTLITYDSQLNRLTYTDVGSGAVLRESRPAARGYQIVGRIADDSYLYARSVTASRIPTGASAIDTVVFALSDDSGVTHELVRAPWRTRFGAVVPDGTHISTPLPLEPMVAYATGADHVYVGFGGDTLIQRFTSAGGQAGTVRVPFARQPLTPDIRRRWQASYTGRMGVPPEVAQRYFDSLPYSDSLPAFDKLLVDEAQRLWVRQFPVPGADSARWSVFSSDGKTLGTLVVPATLDLLHIGPGTLTGLSVREDGVQRVVAYRVGR